jgi:ankyrin repeat protein
MNADNITDKFINACRGGDLPAVKEYIEQGADIHAWDDMSLRWAAERGHLEVVEYLIEQGANIHARYDAALRWAAYKGHLEIVKYLIEHGASIHANRDEALRGAAFNGHLQVANVLRKAAGDKYKCHKCMIKPTCLELCEDFRQY